MVQRLTSPPPVAIGNRYCRLGNGLRLWVVESLFKATKGRPAYAVMLRCDQSGREDVELSWLNDPDRYIPVWR